MTPPVPPLIETYPTLSDWMRVSADHRLSFFTGRVELGQGNTTALLAMVADELDLAPDHITLEPAGTEYAPNEGFTAGSMSIAVGGKALRWAASALRAQILSHAAQKLNADKSTLDLQNGRIFCEGHQTGITFFDLLSAVDLGASIADHAAPKSAEKRWTSFVPPARLDLKDRLTSAPFLHDITLPDMLYGAPVHPPSLTARLISFDAQRVKSCTGVIDIVQDGSFIGIITDSHYHAHHAAKIARASTRWQEDAEPCPDPRDVIAQSQHSAERVVDQGQLEQNAGRWFELSVSRPYLYHGSIGPSAAIACDHGDSIDVITHSQGIFELREALSMVLKRAPAQISVRHHPGAGCYGHNGADDVALDAALMARHVQGRPVKVIWSRHDEFRAAPIGAAMHTRARAFLGDDRKIHAVEVEVNSPPHTTRPCSSGTPNLRAAAYLADPILPARSNDLPLSRGGGADRNAAPSYDIPSVRVDKRLVHEAPFRTSSLRSLGAFNNVIANESLMDDMAHVLGLDVMEFRLAHTQDPWARTVLKRLDQETRRLREGETTANAGWGMGYARYKGKSGLCAVMARVQVDEHVRVTDVYSVSDVGEAVHPDGVKNQIEGGIVQAISWTLKEEVPLGETCSRAESWLDYPILTFFETPRLHTVLLDAPERPPLGAGEISQGPTGAAIANAVRAALGLRITRLPITRDAIIAASFEPS